MGGTFYYKLIALHYIKHVYSTIGVMGDRLGEPVTAGLYKLILMQSGALLTPSVALCHRHHLMHQTRLGIVGIALPLYHVAAMLDIDGTRTTIKTQTSPVPQLESEDAGRSADLKHHRTGPRAVDSTCRNEEVVVLGGWPLVDKAQGIEVAARLLGSLQCRHHLLRVHSRFEAEEYGGSLFGIKQIVALVLSVNHAKRIADILRGGVFLQAEVAATHRVEEVETDGEVYAEACLYRRTQQAARLRDDQVLGRYLETHSIYREVKAVFLRHTVETPSVVGHFGIQPANLLHPLSAPRGRIEEGNQTKRSTCRLLQGATQSVPCNHLGLLWQRGIEPIVHLVDNLSFQIIAYYPVYKVSTFVLA